MKIFNNNFYLALEVQPENNNSYLDKNFTSGLNLAYDYLTSNNEQSRTLTFANKEVLENFFQALCQFFLITPAAGGIVLTPEKKILLIYRKNKWDLPKGKIDAGEKPEQTAKREVEEETGVSNLLLQKHFTNTYHVYLQSSTWVLKPTYWYLFETKDAGQPLRPQREEDIEIVSWFELEALNIEHMNTYPMLAELLNAVKRISL
jgi:8-oxo-dGTP pyrophosphatase MutT (NUDIX family)